MIELEGVSTAPFRVLIVSTGDVSRGPAIERVLRSHLSRGPAMDSVVLTSAGTAAVAGETMHPYTARALTECGVDPRGHAAHRSTERRIAQADLVLTAERAHGDAVLGLHPPARGTTFTLVEFARLAAGFSGSGVCGPGFSGLEFSGSVPSDPRDLVALLDSVRDTARTAARGPGEARGADDLAETAAGSYRDHEHAVRRVELAVRDIARTLTTVMRIPVTGWA